MPADEVVLPDQMSADSSDRALAAGVHVASIFWPILGPLVGWLVFARSKPYVSAHARQALLETLLLKIALFIALVCSVSYTVFRLIHFIQTNWVDFTWQEFLIRFVLGWIALGVLGVVNTALSIMQAYRAWQGRWPGRKGKGYGGATSSDSPLGRL